MKRKITKLLRLISSKQLLTEALHWGGNHHRGQMTPGYASRNDLQTIPIDESARLEVFWKNRTNGKGPAVSLFILEEEILRIDCFGIGLAHMHAAFFLPEKGEKKLFMPEKTVEDQIDRAKYELTRNYRYYQCRACNPMIRNLKLDDESIRQASQKAADLMNGFLATVPEIKPQE
jgi:hypothetical protein